MVEILKGQMYNRSDSTLWYVSGKNSSLILINECDTRTGKLKEPSVGLTYSIESFNNLVYDKSYVITEAYLKVSDIASKESDISINQIYRTEHSEYFIWFMDDKKVILKDTFSGMKSNFLIDIFKENINNKTFIIVP